MLDTSTESSQPDPSASPAEPARFVGPGAHVPALDGLRGFAVVAVVAYHLWPDQVPGGWLGVSLFFTLSGFLVVGLLDNENSAGPVRLARFYRRRVRRLLPAGLVTIAVVVAATLVFEPDSGREVSIAGFWAVLNSANWHQMTAPGGYGAIFDQTVRPLGHMWSLAIEEQFYLTVPLLIAWSRRPVIVVAFGAVAAAAGHVMWWGSSDSYFASPVRAAEIVGGAALILAVRRRPGVAAIGRLWPAAAIVALAAVATVGESSEIVFRGFPAAITIAWVILVAACLEDGLYARFVSMGVWRWLGLRSYAIYLFHWPLIALTDLHPVAIIALTLGLSELSYRVLEDPIRRGRLVRSPLLMLVGAGLVLALIIGVTGLAIDAPTGLADSSRAAALPDWATTTLPPATSVAPTSTAVVTSTTVKLPSAGTPSTTVPDRVVPETPVVVVMGDSTAAQIAAGLRVFGDETETMAVIDASVEGCSALIDPLTDWRVYKLTFGYLGEFDFDKPCRSGIDDLPVVPDLVIMVDHGSVLADHLRADGTWASILDDDLMGDLRTIYQARISEVRAAGAVLVLTTIPRILDPDGHGLFGSMADPDRLAVYNEFVIDLAATEPDVALFGLGGVLDRSGLDGPYTRSDGLHVDLDASEVLAAKVLAPRVDRWLRRPDGP